MAGQNPILSCPIGSARFERLLLQRKRDACHELHACRSIVWPDALILSVLLCRNCLDHKMLRDLGFVVVRQLEAA